jgi:hypothetical protein
VPAASRAKARSARRLSQFATNLPPGATAGPCDAASRTPVSFRLISLSFTGLPGRQVLSSVGREFVSRTAYQSAQALSVIPLGRPLNVTRCRSRFVAVTRLLEPVNLSSLPSHSPGQIGPERRSRLPDSRAARRATCRVTKCAGDAARCCYRGARSLLLPRIRDEPSVGQHLGDF